MGFKSVEVSILSSFSGTNERLQAGRDPFLKVDGGKRLHKTKANQQLTLKII